jgi:hypothetical protein
MQAWFAVVAGFRDLLLGSGLDDMKNQALTACMTKVRDLTEALTGK